MSAGTVHPFVAAWEACGDSFAAVLARWTGPRTPELETLQRTCDAVARRCPPEEALRALEAIDLDTIDPDLANVLLTQWSVVLRVADRPVPDWLRRKGHALVHPGTPFSLRRLAAMRDERAPHLQGNIVEQLRRRRENVACFPTDHPRYWRAIGSLGNFLADLGRVGEIAERLQVLETQGQEAAELHRLNWFTDHVMTGRIEAASALLGAVLGPGRVFRPFDLRTIETAWLLRFMRAESERASPPAPEPGEPGWAATVRALLTGDATAALEAARAYAATPIGGDEVKNDRAFPALNLIRAELAARNADAARHLLRVRHGRGNHDTFDGVLLARCALLDRDWAAARAWWRAARDAADRYDAQGRITFELALAVELQPADLWRLGSAPDVPIADPPPVLAPVVTHAVPTLVGQSTALVQVREQVARFAPLEATVLVLGETGTGKELVARALHDASPRAAGPFVDVNCSSLPESLIESELFGHVRGAFTGAGEARPGLFQAAAHGTLFLDEIGDMPPAQQARLLRVLETGTARPVGGTESYRLRCRVVAATNVDLTRRVADGAFRADLLYRLRRLAITIPPLRERREDVIPLALHFLSEGRPAHRPVRLTATLERALTAQLWPGNVRELRAAMERLRILNSDADVHDLAAFERTAPPETMAAEPAAPDEVRSPADGLPGRSALRRRERLGGLLRRHRRLTRLEVAAILGVAPATAGRDLHALVGAGHARKVCPSRSPRSHYFEWVG